MASSSAAGVLAGGSKTVIADRNGLCSVTLASMLMTACNTLAATLCYICEGHIDKTVEVLRASNWDECKFWLLTLIEK
ncbi:hypothetical protein FH972_010789 [Carpinus fangiana]|uniref:Uncharacterized protein n=1 Tax=Carpinus fangiana TaxID=176857 RepID=A0A660KR73_9ROSI|nr:hypothetical protein FH972_010789 [Carpinus fangiana]